jgi:UDP-N-acetyl-D-mannosaminuronate dehydrogenase
MGKLIANSISRKGLKKIGVLGLSYKGDLKVSVLSKVIPLVKSLLKKKLKVRLFDPYFSKKEIYKAVKVKTFNFPNDLAKFDCLIVTVDHKQFKIQKKILEKHLKKCKLIIDHDGAWKKYNLKNNYHLTGSRGWI